jgi:hypothetical protein
MTINIGGIDGARTTSARTVQESLAGSVRGTVETNRLRLMRLTLQSTFHHVSMSEVGRGLKTHWQTNWRVFCRIFFVSDHLFVFVPSPSVQDLILFF